MFSLPHNHITSSVDSLLNTAVDAVFEGYQLDLPLLNVFSLVSVYYDIPLKYLVVNWDQLSGGTTGRIAHLFLVTYATHAHTQGTQTVVDPTFLGREEGWGSIQSILFWYFIPKNVLEMKYFWLVRLCVNLPFQKNHQGQIHNFSNV